MFTKLRELRAGPYENMWVQDKIDKRIWPI